MNRLKSLSLISCVIISATSSAVAADFLDTRATEDLFNLGVRVGFNASNQTHTSDNMVLNLDSWGTGFDAGVVCDINFRNFIAVQPGFFFQSRSNNYAYIHSAAPAITDYGHTRYTTFTIPILASLRLNPASNIRWSIDLGPYFQFGLGGSDKGVAGTNFDDGYFDRRHKFDAGIKMGTGFRFFDKYYIGVHYMAGCRDVWKNDLAGKHKAWTFTLGYDF